MKRLTHFVLIYFILFMLVVAMLVFSRDMNRTLSQQDQLASTLISLIDSIVPGEL